MAKIYMSSPDISELEEEYVVRAIRSGWIAPLGPDVDGFEADMKARIGVSEAVALSSGTAALHLALLGLGAEPGDVVIASTLTFVATANTISYTGATPFFVDSDELTGNMDPKLLKIALEKLHNDHRRVAAIVPVDLLGKSVDYTAILDVAAEYGVPVLCDAAESLGASHRGKSAGSFGAASIFSFNGNKIMTTSGGGMLLTNDDALAAKARYLATQARAPVRHYEHVDVGYNYRMSNLLAALGRAQLTRLDSMIDRRRSIRERYRDFFSKVEGVEIFGGDEDSEDNCWLTSVIIDQSITGWQPSDLISAMEAYDIETRPLWKPMHMQPAYTEAEGIYNGVAEKLFATGITLPSGSNLSEVQLTRIFTALEKFLEG